MIRVGVVGCGGMGNVHARQYRKMSDVESFAFDLDAEKLKSFCETHQVTPTASFEDLLSKVDAVDICLPTDFHHQIALPTIASGLHLLVEKPMARTAAECEEMAIAADKAGTLLIPGHVVRYFPDFRKGHDLVKAGAVGQPAAARTRRGGKTPMGAGGWFRDASRSGGVLFDLAIHDFDWLRWTIGEVTAVTARSVAMTPGLHDGVGDYGLATLEFENGAIAHVEATWLDPAGFRTTFEVCGSGGMIEHDSRREVAMRMTKESGLVTEGAITSSDDPYFRQLRGFINAVQGKTKPEVTALDGLKAVQIAEAVITSASNLAKVRLNFAS